MTGRHIDIISASPEHGDRIQDWPGYVRETMRRVCADLGEPSLQWIAVCHFDTDQPHAHVLLPGQRSNGRDLVMPRAYIAHGIRARAQEVAQERLGDLSRQDAERRIWRETQADRFTAFDRRLLTAAGQTLSVADHEGAADTWSALMRGRLHHLERLGLAIRRGRRFHLAPDLKERLQSLQTSRDIIRTLNQRRLEGGRAAEAAQEGRLAGRVVKAGYHDEIGAEPCAVIEMTVGKERYVRLATGSALSAAGSLVDLIVDGRGVARAAGKALDRLR